MRMLHRLRILVAMMIVLLPVCGCPFTSCGRAPQPPPEWLENRPADNYADTDPRPLVTDPITHLLSIESRGYTVLIYRVEPEGRRWLDERPGQQLLVPDSSCEIGQRPNPGLPSVRIGALRMNAATPLARRLEPGQPHDIPASAAFMLEWLNPDGMPFARLDLCTGTGTDGLVAHIPGAWSDYVEDSANDGASSDNQGAVIGDPDTRYFGFDAKGRDQWLDALDSIWRNERAKEARNTEQAPPTDSSGAVAPLRDLFAINDPDMAVIIYRMNEEGRRWLDDNPDENPWVGVQNSDPDWQGLSDRPNPGLPHVRIRAVRLAPLHSLLGRLSVAPQGTDFARHDFLVEYVDRHGRPFARLDFHTGGDEPHTLFAIVPGAFPESDGAEQFVFDDASGCAAWVAAVEIIWRAARGE